MTKGSIHQEDITVLNMCISNSRASRYMRGEIEKYTVVVRTSTSPSQQQNCYKRVSKDIENLGYAVHQHDLIDIYGTLHPTTVEYTLFFSLVLMEY